jgi:hypothetical protein
MPTNPTEYTRLLVKGSNVAGVVPTIPTGTTIDNTWLTTDLLKREMFVNSTDDKVWIRTENGLYEFTNPSAYFSGGTVYSATTFNDYVTFLGGNNIPYATGGTYTASANTLTLNNNGGGSLSITGFSSTDTYVTGGTYSTGTAIFTNNTGGTFSVSGFTTGGTQTLAQVLANGNETLGHDIKVTIGDEINFTPSATTGYYNKLVTIDNGGDYYTTNFVCDYNNGGTGASVNTTVGISNLVGLTVETNEPNSGTTQNYGYYKLGVDGINFSHQNKTTLRGYAFNSQNEGYTPGGGGEPDYGVKTNENWGNSARTIKSRDLRQVSGATTDLIGRSESYSSGTVVTFNITLQAIKRGAMDVYTADIIVAAKFGASKIPSLIGSPIITEFYDMVHPDFTVTLDTTPNAGRVLFNVTNNENNDLDWTIRYEENYKQRLFN